MKKVIVLVVIIVVLAAVSGVCIYLAVLPPKEGYTREQIESAESAGKESGAAYRVYLEKLLAELKGKIESDGGDFSGAEFEEIMRGITDKMDEQDKSIEELTADRFNTLLNSKETLVSMCDFYSNEIVLLSEQRDNLDAKILEIEEITEGIEDGGGDGYTQELAGFVSLRDYVTTVIASYEDNLSKLELRIAEVESLIAEMERGR